jgi:cysteine desulfurase
VAELVGHRGLAEGPIYLDYNATTPVDPRVVEAMLPYLVTHFGNPSSSYTYAERSRQALDEARAAVARLLGCRSDEVVFTGGGSESDTLAIRGAALARSGRGDHVVTQQTEHPAILEACRSLERLHGFHVTYLAVDRDGRVDPGTLRAAITPRTVLVSIMHANNETGTMQPIAELSRSARERGVLFHTDAAQSVGKVPVRVDELGVDLLSMTGHKLYAPKGVGALFVRSGIRLEPTIYGGGQEGGRRSGTENVPLIVALGKAASLAHEQLSSDEARLRRLRDLLHERLDQRLPGRVRLNGHAADRLPNTLNVSIAGMVARDLLAATPALAAATGSACHEGSVDPSAVLGAMGVSPEQALGAVRLTVGRWTSEEEIELAARLLADAALNQ